MVFNPAAVFEALGVFTGVPLVAKGAAVGSRSFGCGVTGAHRLPFRSWEPSLLRGASAAEFAMDPAFSSRFDTRNPPEGACIPTGLEGNKANSFLSFEGYLRVSEALSP